jgi:hypothetical protein
MPDDKITTIKLKTATRGRLADYGKKSETFDQIVNRLLDEVYKRREDMEVKAGKVY